MPFVKPFGKVLVGGNPIVEELVAEGVNCKPGLFVVKGSSDWQVALAGDGASPLGVLDADSRYPIAQAFPDNFPVKVLKAPAIVVATLASGNSVVKGAPLVCGANGKLKAAVALSVAVPAGETPVTSNAAQPNLVEAGSVMPGGPVVAYAEETVDASSGDKPIMVRLVI